MSSNLRVLHICSDFSKQRVYGELVAQLDAVGVEQFVYVPVRSREELEVNRNESLRRAAYRYSHILRPRHRLLFRSKIKAVVRDIVAHVDPRSFTRAHAHFLYSDGATALALNERFGLPYVTAVRNTDVNVFMRFRPDLRWIGWEVAARAQHLVFITPAYLDLVIARAPAGLRPALRDKALVIPNGLSRFWLDNAADSVLPSRRNPCLKLLYVGELSRNKNITTSIRATALLNERREASLTLVGAGGDAEAEIDGLLASGKYPFVRRFGRIEDPARLAAIYRAHDIFVMPSFRETFGVAYIEALSQGLPIVFTRGQGVDGYFEPGTVGEAVNPHDAEALKAAILGLAERLDERRSLCVAAAKAFDWQRIAREYVELYQAGSTGTMRPQGASAA